MCVRERDRARVNACTSTCVCVRKREQKGERAATYVAALLRVSTLSLTFNLSLAHTRKCCSLCHGRVCVYVCVCVCERERESVR